MTKEVMRMETSLRGLIGGKVRSGMTKSVEAFYRNVTTFSALNALPRDLLAHGVPYEATRTYRIMKCEFEHKRNLAMVEVHRQRLLGF